MPEFGGFLASSCLLFFRSSVFSLPIFGSSRHGSPGASSFSDQNKIEDRFTNRIWRLLGSANFFSLLVFVFFLFSSSSVSRIEGKVEVLHCSTKSQCQKLAVFWHPLESHKNHTETVSQLCDEFRTWP